MKKIAIVLILLFSIGLKGQNVFMQNGGALAHNLAGQAIGSLAGWYMYKKTHSIFVGSATCFLAAVAAGIFKEEVIDRNLKMGTPSLGDKIETGKGGGVGAIVLIPFMKRDLDRIYEAEQMCSDLKNPVFLRDSI